MRTDIVVDLKSGGIKTQRMEHSSAVKCQLCFDPMEMPNLVEHDKST
jgi:hypothetical protein